MALRFLHSADWQLGREFPQVTDPAMRARLHDQRFDAVRRLGELAARHDAQLVLVAGDVFESNMVGEGVVQQAADALAEIRVPVLLLPGNHDPAAPEGALDRLRGRAGDHVHVLDTDDPARDVIEGLVVHPCPLRPGFHGDPTAHLGPAPRDGRIHLVLAHGGDRALAQAVQDRPDGAQLDLTRLGELGYDYVALGDWHSVLEVAPRVWYPSTPERYTWKERDPGHALLVEIERAGAQPQITTLDVGRSRWVRLRETLLAPEDFAALRARIDALPELSHTWLRLSLSGSLALATQADLASWLDELAARCGQLDVERLEFSVPPDDDALDELALDPILHSVAKELLAAGQIDAAAASAAPELDDHAAADPAAPEDDEAPGDDPDPYAEPIPGDRAVARAALGRLLQAWRDAEPSAPEAP